MEDEFETRIRDLRRRIEELRNRLYPARSESLQRSQEVVQQGPNLEQALKRKREEELNDLKRKLMGGKK